MASPASLLEDFLFGSPAWSQCSYHKPCLALRTVLSLSTLLPVSGREFTMDSQHLSWLSHKSTNKHLLRVSPGMIKAQVI